MFSLVLMSTSCEKDPAVFDEVLTQSVIIDNEWESVSYNGVPSSCDFGDFTNLTLNNKNTGDYDIHIIDNCTDIGCYVDVTLLENGTKLDLAGGSTFEFDVVSYETKIDHNGVNKLLTLQLTFTNVNGVPENGVYVLKRK